MRHIVVQGVNTRKTEQGAEAGHSNVMNEIHYAIGQLVKIQALRWLQSPRSHSGSARTQRFSAWSTQYRGAKICMITHGERFAQPADRTIHLFDGRIVEDRMAA